MNKHVEPPVRLGARAAAPAARRAHDFARQEIDPAKEKARFRSAARHSRRVRFYRWALPLGVIAVLGGTMAYNYLGSLTISVDLPFDLGRVSLSGSRVKMEFPQLHGFTADNRGYNVSAESAFQDLKTPGVVELEKIKANLELADNGWVQLVAATGRYDTKAERFRLSNNVEIETAAGYKARLKDALVDVKKGTMVSNKPVELTYLDSKLTADSIEVSQKDSRALLVGNVQLDFIMPPADGDKAAAPAGTPAVATPSPIAASPVAKAVPGAAPKATAPAIAAAPAVSAPLALAPGRANAAAAPLALAPLPAPGTYEARVGPVPITTSGGATTVASTGRPANVPANVPLPPRRPPMLRGSTTVGSAP